MELIICISMRYRQMRRAVADGKTHRVASSIQWWAKHGEDLNDASRGEAFVLCSSYAKSIHRRTSFVPIMKTIMFGLISVAELDRHISVMIMSLILYFFKLEVKKDTFFRNYLPDFFMQVKS
jgi:hypothetical protein